MRLEILTPHGIEARLEVSALRIQAYEGKMGVLRNHAPFLGMLKKGVISCDTEEGRQEFRSSDGFIKIEGNHIDIFVDWCKRDENH